ncbi:MAG: hypothetical protein Ta2G_19990 [Termitinemataceae bacterium]|nr:MAG: hypothetical protein Ta2G_19990 [Termitinemataceae bacterium]
MSRNKESYDERKKNHLCVGCGIRLPKSYTKVNCPACLADLRRRQKALDPEYLNAVRRERYIYRRDVLHVCTRCAKKTKKGYSLCPACLAEATEYNRTKAAKKAKLKKALSKKSASKKTAVKKPTVKKAAVKKTVVKKPAVKKTAVKKAAVKKTAAKKTVAKKTAAKKRK